MVIVAVFQPDFALSQHLADAFQIFVQRAFFILAKDLFLIVFTNFTEEAARFTLVVILAVGQIIGPGPLFLFRGQEIETGVGRGVEHHEMAEHGPDGFVHRAALAGDTQSVGGRWVNPDLVIFRPFGGVFLRRAQGDNDRRVGHEFGVGFQFHGFAGLRVVEVAALA